jgi:hypothetical protein
VGYARTIPDGSGLADDYIGEIELPLDSVGHRLLHAREAAGLSLADVAARTRIAERHLAAIEQERFADLASSTYAVGFARAYAREVGLDEMQVAQEVRAEIGGVGTEPRTSGPTFEPGDPARVPPPRMAWLAGLVVVGVILAVFLLWRSYFAPSVSLPDLTADATPAASVAAHASAPATPPVDPNGAVVFTARAEGVWVKFYDAAGTQLMQKQMALGESYTVPATVQGPRLWTARPDVLAITVGGRPVPPLSDRQVTMKDVDVSAAALIARPAPASSGAALPAPAAVPQSAAPTPTTIASPAPRPTPRATATPKAVAPTPRREAPAAEAAPPAPAAVETSTVSN